MTKRHRWMILTAVACFVAARGGNWLLSQASNGASLLAVAATWGQIAVGVAVAIWAARRWRSQSA